MTDVHEALRAYVEAAHGEPVVWGASDCSAWSAQWVRHITGRDMTLPRWETSEEAYALIAEAGSLDVLWTDALLTTSLRVTGDPQPGDVGVIDTGRFGQVGGIFLDGGYFAWRAENGTRFLIPRQIVKAWSIQ